MTDDRSSSSGTPRRLLAGRRAPLLATVVIVAAAAVLATWPLARHAGDATLASGEVLLTAWQLNEFQHALLTNPLAWADANIFHPYDRTAALNDLLLAHALLTLPVAAAASPVLALNLALLGGIVLCGVFAHLLIAELTGSPRAAVVGGVLFALTPFRFLHLGHLSIAAAWAIPLFFWALLRHLREPSWARAALASGSGVLVGLSSLYHAAYVAPIAPLVLLFGARRGPGGRRTWLPLLATGLPGLALLASFLAPYAAALRSFGVAAAPGDLLRYGADLSSLGQKPGFLGGAGHGISQEAQLYPGAALVVLAGGAAVIAALSFRARGGRTRRRPLFLLALVGALAVGVWLAGPGPLGPARQRLALVLIWLGPVAAGVWAIAATRPRDGVGPSVAIRLGIAGAALSFALALGPQARYRGEVLGPAPYWLLARASSAFEGTRVPARFGGILILFLAVAAAGATAALLEGESRRRRLAGHGLMVAAVLACLGELPVSGLSGATRLVPLPELRDPAYAWIREQPGRFAVLELPDWPTGGDQEYEYKAWRSLRYMLASKQHNRPLANGTARVEPFLWRRFRRLAHWSDEQFAFLAAYFPVGYVLVHEGGIPEAARDAVWARLDAGGNGWSRVFRSNGVRVYSIDRSLGRGRFMDRLYLRHEISPRAKVTFSARVAPADGPDGDGFEASSTLELQRDGERVDSWTLDGAWRDYETTVPVDAHAPADSDGWPRTAVRLSWLVHPETAPPFEIRGLAVDRFAPTRPR